MFFSIILFGQNFLFFPGQKRQSRIMVHARIQEFSSGGPGHQTKKSSDNVLFF